MGANWSKNNFSKQKIELIAIGGSNNKILILESLKFNIYQIIEEHKSIVYSLAQYKNNFNFWKKSFK